MGYVSLAALISNVSLTTDRPCIYAKRNIDKERKEKTEFSFEPLDPPNWSKWRRTC